jgi:hypothetical protein
MEFGRNPNFERLTLSPEISTQKIKDRHDNLQVLRMCSDDNNNVVYQRY